MRPSQTSNRGAFGLLHPGLKEQLYRMQWTELRGIQVDAIHEIIEGDHHLVIAAATASGKTEAAFLPILSLIAEDYRGGVRVAYLGPLKALINDQFRRVAELCERMEIPVHKWHGDVGREAKRRLREKPSGILLITPESVESLFINHAHYLDGMFRRLSFIVIDEMHSFIGTERGAHLQSLLSRLVRKSDDRVRLIGLSATFGEDIEGVCRWMLYGSDHDVRALQDDTAKAKRVRVNAYLRRRGAPGETCATPDSKIEDIASRDQLDVAADLLKAFQGKTALIFGNAKAELEFYADLVRRMAKRQCLPDLFRVHHGSLSKAEREDVESELQAESKKVATFCSSTLEMGIDVGDVQETGQIGVPWSVSSLTQRIGRSGRAEDAPSVMRLFLAAQEPFDDTTLTDRLMLELIRAIAMIELMGEKWCEPPAAGRLHLSTLVQQIMSVIAERGGARADSLSSELVSHGAFGNVTADVFKTVLKSMGAHDIIEQAPDGELILGLAGERMVRSMDFYAAFTSSNEYSVFCEGRKIGSVEPTSVSKPGDFLILAGRRWEVVAIDESREAVTVKHSAGGRLPVFRSSAFVDIHPRVHAKMRELLLGGPVPAYLDDTGNELLNRARTSAREARLGESQFVGDSSRTVWFTWAGSRVNRTLAALGSQFSEFRVEDEGVALTFPGASPPDIVAAYARFLAECPATDAIAARFHVAPVEKYEKFLPERLLVAAYAHNSLDRDGALQCIRKVVRKSPFSGHSA